MPSPRPTPFDLAFGGSADARFQRIRAVLADQGRAPTDRDAFLIVPEAVSLLRELRPAEGLGEAIDQLVALVHHCYLFWDAGCRTVELGQQCLPELLRPSELSYEHRELPPSYVQVPEHRLWAQVVDGEPQEPLDGCFVHSSPERHSIRVLGVFGLHPDRAGVSVVEAVGRRPETLLRPDGSPLFSSVLPGGRAAGLYSITGEEELLELGWRMRAVSVEPAVEAR
jgi:hypothetical protein